LREINKSNWEFAYHLLQCVAVASRPLRVEELAEFLAFDFKAGPIPKFHEDWCLEDPVDAVLSTCSSLLVIVNVEGSPVIQFSHFSVREFLTSTRLAESSDVISRRYHISLMPAHALMAQACLGILLHLDENVTGDNLEKFPLTKYAAKHWVDHARFEDVLQHVDDGLKCLFDPGKPHLAVSVWIHHPTLRRKIQRKRPLPCPRTPLHFAALLGLHAIVEFLVNEHSQDVHSQDFVDSATPLHLASRWGHVEAVRMLLKLGADVTAQSKYGWTPLHLSSRRGDVEVTRMLLEHGADVSAQNNLGLTPLLLASRNGNVEVTRILLERGADLTAQEKDGSTSLHLASVRGHADVACVLLEHGADVSAQNNVGMTPLLLASRSGNVQVTRTLLEHGADVSAQDKDGSTALHLALQMGRAAVACMLLGRGADVTARDKDDASTPLHLASLRGHVEVVRMLLDRGADAEAQNKHGLTPLDLASQAGHAKVVRILPNHDVDAIAQDEQE
jgi:ankyrin repeat protein